MPIILFISTDAFSNSLFTIDSMAAISQHSHPHFRSLSVSPLPCLFPFLIVFDIKTLASVLSLSIEIQISNHPLVLISKVSSIWNSSFWHWADVKLISNDLVHAMHWLAISFCMSQSFRDKRTSLFRQEH